MPFDEKVWDKPAIQGEVAAIAIHTWAAVSNLKTAIEAMKEGSDPTSHLDAASNAADDLHKVFRELTGYYTDGE